MRLFLAVPAASPLSERACSAMDELRASGADLKWTEPGNLHWTLHFFGAVEPSGVAALRTLTREAARGQVPFELELDRIGAFPSMKKPSVVWAGLKQGGAELTRLAEAVQERVRAQRLPVEDRPFHPHLTLGRVRSDKRLGPLRESAGRLDLSGASMTARELVLYESRLSAQGPDYEPLERAPFAAEGRA